MTDIAVVGAGVAGLGVAYALRDADVDVIVFERCDTVGGRAATRRRAGCVYDVGANYVQSRDDRVSELVRGELSRGLVDVDAPVWTFDATGEISEGRDEDAPKWTYREGIAALGDRLATASDAELRTGTEVTGLACDGDGWRVEAAAGETNADAIVLTPPAPQTAELLAGADWDDPRRDDLPDAIAAVPYRTVLTVALHYDHPVERPYYALVDVDKEHDLGWVARESCKPGHVPNGESLLIVQPSSRWSAERYDDADDEVAAAAADCTAELLDDPDLHRFDWADVVRWRDALPDAEAGRDALDRAADAELFFAGDWVAGEGRVHAALRSGLETGDEIAERLR